VFGQIQMVILGCRIGWLEVEIPGSKSGFLTADVGPVHHDGIDAGVVTGGAIEPAAEFFETCRVENLSG